MIKRLGLFAFFLLVLIVIGTTLTSCKDWEIRNNPASGEGTVRVQVKVIRINVEDYGNGVLYFHSSGAEFGRQFSAWRATHPKWIIIAVAPDDSSYGGYTTGYFVIANQDL